MKQQEVLRLTPQEVRDLVPMDECIAAVEQAFRFYGEGAAVPSEVLSMHVPQGGFHIKAGLLDVGRQYFGAKVNGNFPENGPRFGLPTIQGIIVLCDAQRGCPLAIMDSRDITSLRTGAATAVAARHLARLDSRTVKICGCGSQGRLQIKALSRVFRLETVFAYDQNPEQMSRFASEVTEELGFPTHSITNLHDAVSQSDICVTCTPSRQAYLSTKEVSPGTFVSAVGAD